MSKYRKGILYVRRLKPNDRCDSWLDAIRLAAHKIAAEKRGSTAYVLVRHGQFRNGCQPIMASGATKRDLLASIHVTGTTGLSPRLRFRSWRDRPQAPNRHMPDANS